MQLLSLLVENEGIQNYIAENGDNIDEASQIYLDLPSALKEFIYENLEDFIVPNNIDETRNNIRDFVAVSSVNMLTDLCNIISGKS